MFKQISQKLEGNILEREGRSMKQFQYRIIFQFFHRSDQRMPERCKALVDETFKSIPVQSLTNKKFHDFQAELLKRKGLPFLKTVMNLWKFIRDQQASIFGQTHHHGFFETDSLDGPACA